ncbi:MAG: hypothetical protein IPK67_00005 [Planctomycetes bacterium]|nr:hypothetical protein [Planctomycetota bacterium]
MFVIFRETKLGQLRDGDIDLWRRYVNLYIQGDPDKGQPGDLGRCRNR